jgi:hypothetical protein
MLDVTRPGRTVRGRMPGPEALTRLLAVTALLVAVWIVLVVVLQAREPAAGPAASHLRPLPRDLFAP